MKTIVIISIVLVIFITLFRVQIKTKKTLIDSNQLIETNIKSMDNIGNDEEKKSDGTIVISSPDLEKENIVIDKRQDSTLSQIKKGIQNFFQGTLINTIYDDGETLITNYDYTTLLPSDDLKLESDKHRLLYQYTYKPEVMINDENGKLHIECFGNLKKCCIINGYVGLFFENAEMFMPESPFVDVDCEITSFFVNLSKKQIENLEDSVITSSTYNKYYWNNRSIADEFFVYVGYAEELAKFDKFTIVNLREVDSFSEKYGHYGYWLDQPNYKEDSNLHYSEQIGIKVNSKGRLEIYDVGNLKYYINNNIVSFVREMGDYSLSYYVYNIDVDNRKIICDDELFSMIKADEKSIIEEVMQSSVVQEIVLNSIYNDEDDIKVHKFYFNGEGHLCCCVGYLIPTGVGYAEILYDTVTKSEIED